MSAIAGIDHALIGVADLARAAADWRRLGFTLTPLGRHVGRQTGNHCIMLGSDYLELIGIVDADGPPSRLSDMLAERGEGLIGAAMAPTSAEAALAQFRAAGLAAQPASLERPVDGGIARFELVELPAEATPAFRMFVCGQLTRALVWRPEWQRHANGALGIAALSVLAADPPALAPAWERLLGAGRTTLTDDVLTLFVGDVPVVLARPEALQAMYPQAEIDPEGPLPRGAAISLWVDDPAPAAGLLAAAGIACHSAPDGSLTVAPADATGAILEFRPRR